MKRRSSIALLYGCLLAMISSSSVIADSDADVQFSVSAVWVNKYVSEGRDNLDSGGLFSLELSSIWQQITFGGWFANGDTESYQEVNLYLIYEYELFMMDSYISYTRLEFPKDDEKDNEFAAGLAYSEYQYLTPSADYTWSTEADGGFLELTLSSLVEFQNPDIAFIPYLTQAFDFGYATSDYNGPNNFQIGVEALIEFDSQIVLSLNVNHSWAQEDVERDGEDNVTWFGIGLVLDF